MDEAELSGGIIRLCHYPHMAYLATIKVTPFEKDKVATTEVFLVFYLLAVAQLVGRDSVKRYAKILENVFGESRAVKVFRAIASVLVWFAYVLHGIVDNGIGFHVEGKGFGTGIGLAYNRFDTRVVVIGIAMGVLFTVAPCQAKSQDCECQYFNKWFHLVIPTLFISFHRFGGRIRCVCYNVALCILSSDFCILTSDF